MPDDLFMVHGDNDHQLYGSAIQNRGERSQALECWSVIAGACTRPSSTDWTKLRSKTTALVWCIDSERLFTPFFTTKVNGTGLDYQ
jgi:hypothetical protein